MEIILKYFPNLTDKQKHQFNQIYPLYDEWNQKVNVISRKDIDQLYERHVLHSLAIAKFVKFTPNTSILDVGTGGGFPGIPLAILFPQVNFHLIDSIGKKIKVVEDISNQLNLTNVKTEQIRAEKIKNKYDFIISRAVTKLPPFINWIKYNISSKQRNNIKNGILYLKGGDLQNELQDYKNASVQELSFYYDEIFFETKKLVYLPFPYQQ